jgi:hypothetical protein
MNIVGSFLPSLVFDGVETQCTSVEGAGIVIQSSPPRRARAQLLHQPETADSSPAAGLEWQSWRSAKDAEEGIADVDLGEF